MLLLTITQKLAQALPKYKLLEPSVIGETGTAVTVELTDYVQRIYRLSVTLGAVLAVLIIVYAGVEYILSFKITSKEAAKKRIASALWGLFLLIIIVLLLWRINPELINLKTLNPQL